MIQFLEKGLRKWIGVVAVIPAVVFFSSPAMTQLSDPFPEEAWHIVYDGGYGHDVGQGVAIDSQNNVVVAGYRFSSNPAEGYNAYARKYDSLGNYACEVEVKGPPGADTIHDYFYGVAVDSQDNIIVAGTIGGSYAPYYNAPYLNKYDQNCSQVWGAPIIYLYPGDSAWNNATSVIVASDDNIFMVGEVFGGWGGPEHEWAIWKYNSSGNLQLGFPFFYDYSPSYPYPDYGYDIAIDNLGNIIAVGIRGVSGVACGGGGTPDPCVYNNYDWHVRKYNSTGTELIWEDTFSGPSNRYDYAYRVAVDSQNNPIVVGYTNKGTDNGTNADYDWLMIKYSANGLGGTVPERLWTKTYESSTGSTEQALGVAVDCNDNIIVAGTKRIDPTSFNMRLVLLDKDTGDDMGERIITDPANIVPYRLAYRNGAIAIGGYVWDPAGANNNIYTALLQDPSGPIEPTSPLSGATFDACSYFSPPTFEWTLNQSFGKLELRFYTSSNPAKPTKVKVKDPAATQLQMTNKTWMKILKLAGPTGGDLNWKIVGTNKGEPLVESEVYTMTVAAPEPAGKPDISPVSQSSLPTLTWGNSCGTKFKVYFGPERPDPKMKKLTFTDQDPTDNGGVFSTTLVEGTWNAIRKLVDDETGSRMFFYVESWDALKRYQKTDDVFFQLQP